MDWIHVDEELFAASVPIYANADAALYGRTTYDMMANYWPTAGDSPDASEHDKGHSSWLNRATVYVASNTLRRPPGAPPERQPSSSPTPSPTSNRPTVATSSSSAALASRARASPPT